MKILVINAGSSSLKYQLIDMTTEKALLVGICERITMNGGKLKQKNANGKKFEILQNMADHKAAMELVIKAMLDKEFGAINSVDEISAIGHRVLHSGEDFDSSVVIDDEVIKICEKNAELGPLHMPGNIACIKSCKEVMPGKPMVAVFDTTFHATMPEKAYMYGIPYSVYEKYKVRKYGFHGTSHKFVSEEAAKYFGKKEGKYVICHLGNGSSLSAVKDGKCVDTTMGFTPLEGLMMGTRSGDIDPAAVDFIRNKLGLTSEEMVQYLNKKCGVLGITEFDSDMRLVEEKMLAGDKKCTLAVEMLAYRITKYIGSFIAILGGCDAIIFTGGIGEYDDIVRAQIMDSIAGYLGIDFDYKENARRDHIIRELSKADSKVKVMIIPTNEELSIARETKCLVENK